MSEALEDVRVQKALALSEKFGLNKHQTKTMVKAAQYLTMEFLNSITSRDEAIDQIIIPHNVVQLNKGIQERIDQGHYSVMGVGEGKAYYPTLEKPIEYGSDSMFAYSIGVSCREGSNHELFTYGPSIAINEVVSRYPDGNYPTEAIESVWMSNGDKPTRLLILKVSEPSKLIAHYFARISQWLGKNLINSRLTKGETAITTLVLSVLLVYNTLLLHLATNGGNCS